MGRHSSPDQGHFYRSFFGWIGLWAMIAAVTAIGVWLVVGFVGGPVEKDPLAAETRPDRAEEPDTEPAPTVSGARISKGTKTRSRTPASGRPEPEHERKGGKLITDGMTVQVLNATADGAAAEAMGDKLSGLGYSVVAIEESSRAYDETTVFWSNEASRDAAVALAERFGWVVEPKPANLADSVSFHVVVGADEV